MEGWIKLHRKLLQSNIFGNEKYLKVFIWCLLKATYRPHMQQVGRQQVALKKGQFVFGRKKAALELNMAPSTVWEYMKILKNDKVVNIKSNNKYSVVTVVNWEVYQNDDDKSDSKYNNKSTTNQQQIDTNKNVKNDKNNKNTNVKLKFDEDSIEYKLANYLRNWIIKNNPNAKVPNDIKSMQKWCVHIDRMIRIDNRNPDEIKEIIKFCQTDEFWLSNILSTNKLREKYDKLYLKMKGTSKGGENYGQGYSNGLGSGDEEGEIEYDFDFNARGT